jgi:opacity protein-like surface antigen
MHRFLRASVCAALLSTSTISAVAGQPIATESKTAVTGSPFEKGSREFQLLTGAFFSFTITPSDRATFNDAFGTARVGWMLNDISGSGIFRGNNEFLVEVFGSGLFRGPGTGFVGTTLFLRRNFVQSADQTVVPYFQLGVGSLYNDSYKDQSQQSIGAAFEFNLQASLGVRFFLSESCALVLEGGYRHISNADLASRNTGLDSLGASVGVSYFF